MNKYSNTYLQVVRPKNSALARNGPGTVEADPTGKSWWRAAAAAIVAAATVVVPLPPPSPVGTRRPRPTATIGLTPVLVRRNHRTH